MTSTDPTPSEPLPPMLPPDQDPGLVAAGSTAAAALLGTPARTGIHAPGAAGGAGPADALPPVAGAAAVVSPTSRYASTGIATWTAPDGSVHRYVGRRLIPQPEALATGGWDEVGPGDRVDTLAARTLGDPLAFWRLCDAAGVADPAAIETAGTRLPIPLPEGMAPPEAADG